MCERDPVQASVGVSAAKITLISYIVGAGAGRGIMNAL